MVKQQGTLVKAYITLERSTILVMGKQKKNFQWPFSIISEITGDALVNHGKLTNITMGNYGTSPVLMETTL